MKKKQLITALATSTLVLSTAGTAFADEVTPIDPTTPSTEVVTPDPSSQAGQSTEPSTSTETGSTEPTVPVDPTSPSSDAADNNDTQTESTSESSEESTIPNVDDAGSVTTDHTVPTTDGGTATVVPDTSVPTNNPNISAETAANAGASQVGTTSQVTGQVVRDVTTTSPVTTNTGATIVSTQNGAVVLSDGTITSPESVGAKTNSDGTISVTTASGESITLPMTREANTSLLSALGTGLLGLLGFFFKKRHLF